MELGPKEKLLVLQAIYNTIGEQLSTTKKGNLRDQVAESYREIYRLTDGESTSFKLKLGDEHVATFYFTTKEGSPEYSEEVLVADDYPAFADWVETETISAKEFAKAYPDQFAQFLLDTTGEVAHGYKYEERHHEAVKASVNLNGVLRFTQKGADTVLQSLGTESIKGLLQ